MSESVLKIEAEFSDWISSSSCNDAIILPHRTVSTTTMFLGLLDAISHSVYSQTIQCTETMQVQLDNSIKTSVGRVQATYGGEQHPLLLYCTEIYPQNSSWHVSESQHPSLKWSQISKERQNRQNKFCTYCQDWAQQGSCWGQGNGSCWVPHTIECLPCQTVLHLPLTSQQAHRHPSHSKLNHKINFRIKRKRSGG